MKCPWCGKESPGDLIYCYECGLELYPEPKAEDMFQREQLSCTRCEGRMQSLGQRKIQLGQQGLFLGDLPHLFSGALKVEILKCDKCNKLEFYALDKED